ncbi:hypothetical protein [Streptomyces sp. NPDC058086]|uniref:hypothetical protein n=1 Tax=Streptomyces sp. NPDC058086 TaxID=3346334 RepID=UPI0036ECC139
MVNYYLDRLRNDLVQIKIPEGQIWQNEREIQEIFKSHLTGQMVGEVNKLKEIADSAHEGSTNETFDLLADAARKFQRNRDRLAKLPRWNMDNARIKGNAAASQSSWYFPRNSAESLKVEVAKRVRIAEGILSLFEGKWATWIHDLQHEADSWISTPAAGPDQTSGAQAWAAPASWTAVETIVTATVEDVGTLPGEPTASAPDTWAELRGLAEPAAIDTEHFDPWRSGPYEPGQLAGKMGRIRLDARKGAGGPGAGRPAAGGPPAGYELSDLPGVFAPVTGAESPMPVRERLLTTT